MSRYKQVGYNSRYPKEIETWRLCEDNPPYWLTDLCKINIDSEGKISIVLQETNTGGCFILQSGPGSVVFLHLKSKDDYICRDVNGGGISTLTEKQLELLYE